MKINENVVNKLITKGYHISFAESCTGGLCCAYLVDVPNASYVLNESYITYANESKIKILNIDNNIIDKFGVVSEEVAYQMAKGVSNISNSEIGVSITGIAGPTGETKNKPIGMVCFGFNINNQILTFTKYFGNIGRNEVRKKSVEFVFNKLDELLGD